MESVFENIRNGIAKEIQKTKTMTQLKNKLNEILEETDLEEEQSEDT